jgi:hypothetical protein
MTCKTNNYGTKIWSNMKGELHRLGDLPAIEYKNGDKHWYENDKHHRLGGLPAIEYADGGKEWYENGERHRIGGLPAAEYADGDKHWFENGECHRLGGLPAIEYANGSKGWYVNGKRHRLGGLHAIEYVDGTKDWYIYDEEYTHEQVISYYEILKRFGRYCLKKIRLRQLKRYKFIHVELLGMPVKGRFPGGQDSHKIVNYFMNYVKN